jgi:hypothetical protein
MLLATIPRATILRDWLSAITVWKTTIVWGSLVLPFQRMTLFSLILLLYMFVTVGMSDQAVNAFVKVNMISEALDCCVKLNQAVELVSQYLWTGFARSWRMV